VISPGFVLVGRWLKNSLRSWDAFGIEDVLYKGRSAGAGAVSLGFARRAQPRLLLQIRLHCTEEACSTYPHVTTVCKNSSNFKSNNAMLPTVRHPSSSYSNPVQIIKQNTTNTPSRQFIYLYVLMLPQLNLHPSASHSSSTLCWLRNPLQYIAHYPFQ
jgi:hypothetical protein